MFLSHPACMIVFVLALCYLIKKQFSFAKFSIMAWLDSGRQKAFSRKLQISFVFLKLTEFFYYCRLGYTIEKVPGSSFHFSEEMSRQVALSVASTWNSAVNSLKSLCKGNDWMLFLKVSTIVTCLVLSLHSQSPGQLVLLPPFLKAVEQ